MLLELKHNGQDIIVLGQAFYYEGRFQHATLLGYCGFPKEIVAQMQSYFLNLSPIGVEHATHHNPIVRELCVRNLVHLNILVNDPVESIAMNARMHQQLLVA